VTRARAGVVFATGAVVVVAALAACGDDGDPTSEAEVGVAAVLAERLAVPITDLRVTCPDDLDFDPGATFECEIVVQDDPAAVTLDLAVADDGTIELRRAVIPADAAEAYLAAELAPTAEGPVSVDCGAQRLLVRSVGESFDCTATRSADAVAFHVVVDVTAVDGSVHYRVEATTTTTVAIPPTTAPPLPTP
jgi:hypothetical protein